MHKSKRVGQSILKILILITILAGVGVMLTTIYHQQIFSSFVNSRYQSVSNLMPWMVASGAMFAGGQIMSLQFLIAKRPEMMTKVKIVTALIGFILNIVGAYYFGMTGVVAAIFIFSLIYMVWSIYLMYSEDRIMLNALF
jgi:O-antigen/teichoic acid export membrane protein